MTLTDWKSKNYYAYYDSFTVGPESDNYRLGVGRFNEEMSTLENAFGYPDFSVTNQLMVTSGSNGAEFSAMDKDNDEWKYSCSTQDEFGHSNAIYGGSGGWWYLKCGSSNLNGLNGVVNKNKYDYSRMRWNSNSEPYTFQASKMELLQKGNSL